MPVSALIWRKAAGNLARVVVSNAVEFQMGVFDLDCPGEESPFNTTA